MVGDEDRVAGGIRGQVDRRHRVAAEIGNIGGDRVWRGVEGDHRGQPLTISLARSVIVLHPVCDGLSVHVTVSVSAPGS